MQGCLSRGAKCWLGEALFVAALALGVASAAAETGAPPPMTAADGEVSRDRLNALGIAHDSALASGDIALAEQSAVRRVEVAIALGDALELARARSALGSLRRRQGSMEEAGQLLDAALATLREGADSALLAETLSLRAQTYRNQGDYYESLALESESLAIRNAQSPPVRPYVSLFHLAALYEQMEDFERALKLQYQALTVARASGDPGAEGSALTRLAGLLNDVRAEEPGEARGYASAAFAIHERLGNRPGMLDARFHIARSALNAGQLDEAEALFDQAFAEASALRQPSSLAHIQFRRAELALGRERPAEARTLMLDAIERYSALGNRHRLAKAYGVLAEIAAREGDRLLELESRLEHYRLRDRLLGAGATRRVTDLVDRLRASEELARLAVLERDNRIQLLELEQRRFQSALVVALLALALVVAGVLGWRYQRSAQRNRLLQAQSRALAEQGEALQAANRQLGEQARVLEKLANEDALTGLASRSRGLAGLREALEAARRDEHDLAVMILDIDGFKAVNDTYGHLAGDDVLRGVAAVMNRRLGDSGLTARLGGEEFLVVLHDAHPSRRADALRRAIAGLSVKSDGRILRVTVSIGMVRRLQLPEADLHDLLKAADEALYAAKRSGRDRVVCWPCTGDGRVVELRG